MKHYKNRRSAQQARQNERNRLANAPRLKRLKEVMGCHACGRCDVDGDYLEGHHYTQGQHKYGPLAHLIERNWNRLLREILGLDRDKQHGGGPIVFWCERYHHDHLKNGHHAKTCRQLMKEGFIAPEVCAHSKTRRKTEK